MCARFQAGKAVGWSDGIRILSQNHRHVAEADPNPGLATLQADQRSAAYLLLLLRVLFLRLSADPESGRRPAEIWEQHPTLYQFIQKKIQKPKKLFL